ncbi:hypothetical protein BaRGS_00022051 [Batillaria attramentaria]|uniref:Sodium channel modifier 1 n=1 Tax=Batillaria attramentaria TaxID=370345 RepID=A0ABD0KI36_9CAEN
MSFKREGNDAGLLGNLRRRRIKELLSEDVPEDEAKLLCNGRFACLVCSHRPIFDTVDMLTEVSPAAIPLRHTHQLKNIFRPDRSQLDPAAAQPYQSKRSSQCNIGASEGSTVSASSLPLSYSHLSASHSRTAQIPQPRSEANVKGHKPECGGVVYPGVGQGADWAANLVFDGGSPANCDRVVNSGCVVNSEQCGGGDVYSGENVNTVNVTGTAGNTGKDVNSVTGKSAETNVSTEKRKSGWKKDWDGKWIRDEDAEFDSDEEPPDLP